MRLVAFKLVAFKLVAFRLADGYEVVLQPCARITTGGKVEQMRLSARTRLWPWVGIPLLGALMLAVLVGVTVRGAAANGKSAVTLNVCLPSACTYHSINDALAVAPSGATIAVAPGVYTPASEMSAGATTVDTTVTINKPVTLQGAGQGKTILNVTAAYDGTAAYSGVVQITNPGGDVTVSGFTLEGATANDYVNGYDGILMVIYDNSAADTISITNNKFYGDTTLDPQLLGDQEDSIYIADGTERVNVVNNTFQGVFRAALVEGQLGPVNFTNNEINGLHGLYDITTSPPTLYYYAEAVFFLEDNNANVTSPQVVRNNHFSNYDGLGVVAEGGYDCPYYPQPCQLLGVIQQMSIEGNRFDNGSTASVAQADSPDIYVRGLGYTDGSLTAKVSGVTIKNNLLNESSSDGQGRGILLRGDLGNGITIDHNQLHGSGRSDPSTNPANGILFEGVSSTLVTHLTNNLITGYDYGIEAITDPAALVPNAPALPTGASVTATKNCIAGNNLFGATNAGPAIIDAEQNWWGATTGPNTAGADSVGSNVDSSNFLTHPEGDCSGLHQREGGKSVVQPNAAAQHGLPGKHFRDVDP